MKIERASAQSLAATLAVLVILLSGSVYAFSLGGSLSGNAQNAPSPLDEKHSDDEKSDKTRSTTSTSSSSDEEDQHQSSSSTSTSTHTEMEDGDGHGKNHHNELHFRLVALAGGEGQGNANIKVDGTSLDGSIEVEKLASSTTFTVYLIAIPVATTTTSTSFSTTPSTTTTTSTTSTPASCTGTSIGSFVTRGEGDGEADLSATLSPGRYAIGLVLCSPNSPVLVSDPSTITATIGQATEETETSSQTHTSTHETETHNVHTSTAEEHDKNQIKGAENSKTIPAVVQVGNSGVYFKQLDPHFSVSASNLGKNGLQISISGNNIAGSRVLLINLTGSQWTSSSLQGLTVNYDGTPIREAASLSQVLTSSPSDPARYLILVTSSGLQLLVSIPHFSLHIIQIIPSVVTALSLLVANGPLLLTGLIIFSGFAAALYSKRKKFYALAL